MFYYMSIKSIEIFTNPYTKKDRQTLYFLYIYLWNKNSFLPGTDGKEKMQTLFSISPCHVLYQFGILKKTVMTEVTISICIFVWFMVLNVSFNNISAINGIRTHNMWYYRMIIYILQYTAILCSIFDSKTLMAYLFFSPVKTIISLDVYD